MLQVLKVCQLACAGYLTLKVEHPHEPGWKMLQV